jgi:hypothetical protein
LRNLFVLSVFIGMAMSPTSVLAQAGSVAGMVVDAQGNPLDGARVEATDSSNEAAGATRSATDGRFLLGGLKPGTYVV